MKFALVPLLRILSPRAAQQQCIERVMLRRYCIFTTAIAISKLREPVSILPQPQWLCSNQHRYE